VLTDEKVVGFVLEQLLSNALKYTPEGSIRLYAEGDTLVIEDSGIGIRAEDLPRVFEKGFTGYNAERTKNLPASGFISAAVYATGWGTGFRWSPRWGAARRRA
jgi:signal transduction histidine kinase